MPSYHPSSAIGVAAAASLAQSRALMNDPMYRDAILSSQEESVYSMCIRFTVGVVRSNGGDYWDAICLALGVPSP
jgi:hypothetical protein